MTDTERKIETRVVMLLGNRPFSAQCDCGWATDGYVNIENAYRAACVHAVSRHNPTLVQR